MVSKAGSPITMICRVSVRSEQVFQYKHSTSVNITHVNIPSLNKCMHQNLIRHAVLIQLIRLIRLNAPSVQHKVFCLHTRIRWQRHSTSKKIQNTQDVSSKISILYFPPQACEYAGVILVNAILVPLKQTTKNRFVVLTNMGFVC